MNKPPHDVFLELDALRNSKTADWLRAALEEAKLSLIHCRDLDILRSKQGEAVILQQFLRYMDEAREILNR